MWGKLVRNALSNATGTAVSLAAGFVTMPLVVQHLGATDFALWTLASGLAAYLGLFDVGLAPTLVKKSAELLGRDDAATRDELAATASTIYAAYAAAGAAGLAALLGVGALAGHVFTVPAGDLATFQLVLLVVGLQTAIGLPMSIWNGLLAGLEAFPLLNGLGIATSVARATGTIVLLETGHGLLALVVLGAAVSLVAWTASRLAVARRLPALRVRIADFRWARLRAIAPFSGAMVVWTIAGAALHQLDRVLVGIVLPIQSLTTYEVGARLTNYSRTVLHSWLSIVMPAASGLAARRDHVRLRSLYLRATRYLLGSYTAVGAALLGFGAPFIRVWIGPGYDESAAVMQILLLGGLFQSQNVVAHVMLPGIGRLHAFTRFMGVYPLVTTTFATAGILAGGLLGLAAGIAASMFVMESAFVGIALRTFGVSFPGLVRRCHAPVARALVPVVAWIVLLRALVPIVSWTALTAAVGSTIALHAVSFWATGLGPAERRLLVKRARAAVRPRWPAPALSREASC